MPNWQAVVVCFLSSFENLLLKIVYPAKAMVSFIVIVVRFPKPSGKRNVREAFRKCNEWHVRFVFSPRFTQQRSSSLRKKAVKHLFRIHSDCSIHLNSAGCHCILPLFQARQDSNDPANGHQGKQLRLVLRPTSRRHSSAVWSRVSYFRLEAVHWCFVSESAAFCSGFYPFYGVCNSRYSRCDLN